MQNSKSEKKQKPRFPIIQTGQSLNLHRGNEMGMKNNTCRRTHQQNPISIQIYNDPSANGDDVFNFGGTCERSASRRSPCSSHVEGHSSVSSLCQSNAHPSQKDLAAAQDGEGVDEYNNQIGLEIFRFEDSGVELDPITSLHCTGLSSSCWCFCTSH